MYILGNMYIMGLTQLYFFSVAGFWYTPRRYLFPVCVGATGYKKFYSNTQYRSDNSYDQFLNRYDGIDCSF